MGDTSEPTRRWFHVSPDRLILALLAVEGFLFLSERFQWFGFNQHKGWTVLIAVASVGVAILSMLLWFAVALVFRLHFQFSIRSLLVLMLVVALPCSWMAVQMKAARKQREAVEVIVKLGGTLSYGFQKMKGQPWNVFDFRALPPGPVWLRNFIGEDCFQSVVQVHLRKTATTDDDLAILEDLPDLEAIDLMETKISSDGLVHLEGMRRLKALTLWNTSVDDGGLAHLRDLTDLRMLTLDGTKVTDAGMVNLQRLTNLEEWLGLTDTQITDESLKYFKNFTKLKEINLLRTKVTEQGVRDLKNSLPEIRISYSHNGEDRAL